MPEKTPYGLPDDPRRISRGGATGYSTAQVMQIRGYEVASWSPGDASQGDPATEVHIVLHIAGIKLPLVMRLKTRRAVDEMIAALDEHRTFVWPALPESTRHKGAQQAIGQALALNEADAIILTTLAWDAMARATNALGEGERTSLERLIKALTILKQYAKP